MGANNEHAGRQYADRDDAGKQLARALRDHGGMRPLVLGIPRGGVPVAAAVARELRGDLDIIVARKIGAPSQPELAIGAVTANGGLFLNNDLLAELGVGDAYLSEMIARETANARRREELFRGSRPAPSLAGRTVIVVDDGLATGATMRAAVHSLNKHDPAKLIVAAPCGSEEACSALSHEADEVVCLIKPEPFWAVGYYYRDFSPVEDDEVTAILQEFWQPPTGPLEPVADEDHSIAERNLTHR